MPQLPQLPAGAVRLEGTVEVRHEGGRSDYIALYERADGGLYTLIDSFRGGDWHSVLLDPASTDALRKRLNKAHRERNRA